LAAEVLKRRLKQRQGRTALVHLLARLSLLSAVVAAAQPLPHSTDALAGRAVVHTPQEAAALAPQAKEITAAPQPTFQAAVVAVKVP
jgi:hypothetical protein